MYQLYWEQCPLCGHWMLLVAKLRFTHIKSCYTPECPYWETGGEGLEQRPIVGRLVPVYLSDASYKKVDSRSI